LQKKLLIFCVITAVLSAISFIGGISGYRGILCRHSRDRSGFRT
jgi:hypothetical protein